MACKLDLLKYIECRYDNRLDAQRNVHSVYLMALLRIADYLQMQKERAPKVVLMIQTLMNPISRRAWASHQAIKALPAFNKGEEVYVEADPKSVEVYVHLKDLISDIQAEIDASWVALGEVYSNHVHFRKLGLRGLSVRRILSNLESEDLLKKIRYIPRRAAFAANQNLLKHLVGPLYADEPAFGVRELLQNSVDAIREYRRFKEKCGLTAGDPRDDLVRLKIFEDNGSSWIEVSDSGIGMSDDIIIDYFLTAGASFRHSYTWRKEYLDDKGRSSVLRSGRFGVGALAAFLLGEKITPLNTDSNSKQALKTN